MFPEQFFRVCVQAHLYLVQGLLVLNDSTSILDFKMDRCVPVHPLLVGDLEESFVKSRAGMKDSSGLLPGHGGVLDRVDALLPTLPMAMMLVAWI